MTSPFANPVDLALMRAQSQELMPDSWSLVHPTNVNDAQGSTQTWAVTASGTYAGGNGARFMPAFYRAMEAIAASRQDATKAWTITLPHGELPPMQDRLIKDQALAVGTAITDWTNYRVLEIIGSSADHTAEAAVRLYGVEVV